MTFTQKQFEDAVREHGDSPEYVELILSADKFLMASKTPMDVLAAMAQMVAISSVNVKNPEAFIHEIANQAISALRFANAMSKAIHGGSDEQTH